MFLKKIIYYHNYNKKKFHYSHHLPESPPDSGSEHPYSPPDTQNSQSASSIDLQGQQIHHQMMVVNSVIPTVVDPRHPTTTHSIPISPSHNNGLLNQGQQIYTELKNHNHTNMMHGNLLGDGTTTYLEQNGILDGRNLLIYDSIVGRQDLVHPELGRQDLGHADLGQIRVDLGSQLDGSSVAGMVSPSGILGHQLTVNKGGNQLIREECIGVYTSLQNTPATKKRKLSQEMVPLVKCEPGNHHFGSLHFVCISIFNLSCSQ